MRRILHAMAKSLFSLIFLLMSFTAFTQNEKPKMMDAVSADAVGKQKEEKTIPKAEIQENTKQINDLHAYRASGDKSPEWDALVEPGFEAFEAGNFATAHIFLKKAYERGCRDTLLLMKLGIYEESLGNLPFAMELLTESSERLARQYPDHPAKNEIGIHAGRILYKLDRFPEALPHLEKGLASHPDDFMLLFMTAQILRTQKNYEEARARFQKVITLPTPTGISPDPKLTVVRALMSLSCEMQDYDVCNEYANLLLTLIPNDPEAKAHQSFVQKKKLEKREMEIIQEIVK